MPIIRQLLTLLLCVAVVTAFAQQKPVQKSLYIMPVATLLRGDHKTSGAIAVTAGWRYGQWSFGAGGGVDYYKIRSLPLVGEIQYALKSIHTPFLYVQGGYNVAWPLYYQHSQSNGTYIRDQSVYNNGYYMGSGIGMYLFPKWTKGLACTLGYTVKGLTELYDEWVMENPGKYGWKAGRREYTLQRFAFSLAYRF